VSGSKFIPAKAYPVKLEGAEKAGYQSVMVGSIRDPFIIRQIDDWVSRCRERNPIRIESGYGKTL
jgi:hypothetical protein